MPGKFDVSANSVGEGSGADLLLSLSRGEARAERLTEAERISIAVETPIMRALRGAASSGDARHLALVGPPGTGKTFAVRAADCYGMVGFELPSVGAPNAGDVADGIVVALRENRRLLLAARPGDLSTWAARADLSGALAALLQEAREATGTRDDWTALTARSIGVLDLSCAVTLHGDLFDDLLRRSASLALRSPRDTAREAASVALRERHVRAWALACARDAERRVGPLTISDLWRFVATLACGAVPARGRGYFDLAESVAGRLMRHEYMPDTLRSFARAHPAISESALAAVAGFDGDPSALYCSSPQSIAEQAAVFLVDPPSLEAPRDDYAALIKRVAGGVRVSAREVVPPAFAESLSTLLSRAEGAPPRGDPSRDAAARGAEMAASAAAPNPFTQRALGDAWIASLCLRVGRRTLVLDARAYKAACDLATKGGTDALARHPAIDAWLHAPLASQQEPRSPPASAEPRTTGEVRNAASVEIREALRPWKSSSFASRPLGLLLVLGVRGSLDDAISDGGAFRVGSPADLAATTPTLSSHPEHVERWQNKDRIALGAPLHEFTHARAEIVDALAKARSPSTGSRALDACLSLDLPTVTDALSSVILARYLSAYVSLLEAAVATGGEVLERVLMMDVAYCPSDKQRRARLMPLHPLTVSRQGLPEGEVYEALPPVIAMSQHRVFALYAEGEPGFYHGEPERWPEIAEQRAAVRDATRAWLSRAGEVMTLDVDLIDARFPAPLIAEIASCVAERAGERRTTPAAVRARILASSLPRAAWLAPMTDVEIDGVSVTCDPSVRSASEARRDAFVFAVAPASHGGRRPGISADRLPRSTAAYLRALTATRIDPRPHKLEPSAGAVPGCTAVIAWNASPLDEGREGGQWALSLADGLMSPPSSMEAPPHFDSAPSNPQQSTAVELVAAGTLDRPESSSSSERRQSEWPENGGDTHGSGEAVTPPAKRRWTRQGLRDYVARTFDRPAYTSDEALVADIIRDVVSARRCPLRHVVMRDVVESVGSLLERGEPREIVTRTVEALVDLGDLVARRSSERGPYLLELGSAAFVELRSSTNAILLGRAEAALSDGAREAIVAAGPLRALDLRRAREALDELRFRGAAEILWGDWVCAPEYEAPEDALGAQTEMKPFQGNLEEYDAFDPTTPPNHYRRRFRHGELGRILARDRWAVATREASFGALERRLFRSADGAITSVEVPDRGRFIQLAAACAARAAEGRGFAATEQGSTVRLYFPPPGWLARVLAVGQAVDPGDALVAWRVPEELQEDIRRALRRSLWCEVVSS